MTEAKENICSKCDEIVKKLDKNITQFEEKAKYREYCAMT